jgi:sigma-E factor negative regulatory protein RseC
MHREVFYEEGEVILANGKDAVVLLSAGSNCKECFARELCKTGTEEERSLEVKDPLGVRPGDKVRLEVYGSSLLMASVLIYGIPLLLLLAGIAIGTIFYGDLAAGLLGLGLPAVYALGLWLYTRLALRRPLLIPRIVDKVSLE